ncbi:Bud site selection protein 20 [Ascosphaera aggregata]|nr:Bud site selection protein 20 [Ascosphaera aggregata]
MGALRRIKTKRRTRDYDQVIADISSAKHLKQYKETKHVEGLPALGAFYCVECSKWFESEHNLLAHRKGKSHKRRVRLLKEEPHSQKLAEAAIGLTTNNGVRSSDIVVPEAIEIEKDL